MIGLEPALAEPIFSGSSLALAAWFRSRTGTGPRNAERSIRQRAWRRIQYLPDGEQHRQNRRRNVGSGRGGVSEI